MPKIVGLTVPQLVQLGRVDEAVKHFQEQRRAAVETGAKIDEAVRRLDKVRRRLQKAVKDEERDLKKLQQELEQALDRSGFEAFVAGLFGSDGGAVDAGDALDLAQALRGQLVEHAVVLLFRAVNTNDSDD